MRKRAFAFRMRIILGLLVGVLWVAGCDLKPQVFTHRPQMIMGTTCRLAVVASDANMGTRALRRAEARLRQTEALMSTYIQMSELSRLNAAGAGDTMRLSPQTLAVLGFARRLLAETDGAFDVTCGPLIDLWQRAGKTGRLPSDADLSRARADSRWVHIALLGERVVKSVASARINLGGIAKGYAIDQAVEAMRAEGCVGGLVDVGGDVRCFGDGPQEGRWEIGIRDPFGKGMMDTLLVTDVAVCTSGNYARFVTIAGKRYSHILDPRTGWPADATPSVTVLGPTAMWADGWATALSVLGIDGLKRLPEALAAQIVVGTAGDFRVEKTAGFELRIPR